jgi:Na+-transporting methylmalonyl-CoA/oxaloacetate decarboxylase gamma subunit
MDQLNSLLADNLALVVAGMGLLLLILLVLVAIQSARLGRAVRDYRALVGDGRGGSLREVLDEHVGRVDAVARRLGEMDQVHASLEHRTLTSLQHIGLVRFNPFEDTGSDQSFAIALLDGERDGIVISSLHGRANTRVFAKPVQGGSSPHALSAEEEQAIRIAVSGTGQAAGG